MISEGSINESDDDTDRHHAVEEESDGDGDDDDDMFADARDFLSSNSVRANGNDDGKSSSESNDEGNHPSEDGVYSGGISVENKYPYVRRRKKLPDPVEEEKGVSLWSMIKDNIGKDLTKVCLPVYFNEPLSSLQKSFEDFEYSYLLDQAYESGKVVSSYENSYFFFFFKRSPFKKPRWFSALFAFWRCLYLVEIVYASKT